MQTTFTSLRRGAVLICAGAALALPASRAADSDVPTGDAFPTFESYIKVSGYGPEINGDHAAFATRTDIPNTGAVGIEDLFFTKDISDGTTMKINGRAMAGSDDYLLSLNLTKDNVGSIEAGYKSFRTFYDGVGGFFPLSDQFYKMSPESLHVDRGSFWVDTKFAKGNSPVFTLSFHDDTRTGDKDSTIWAPTIGGNAVVTASGTLVGTASPANTPYVLPNLLSLSEHHRTLEASMTASIGKTTETLKANFDWVGNVDTRYYTKYANSNVVATAATLTATPAVSATYYPINVLDDQEAVTAKTFRLTNQTETALSSHVSLEVGLSYSRISADDGGEWITPAYNTTAKAIFPAVTAGNVATDARVDDYVGNVFLKITPTKDWLCDIGYRQEYNVIADTGSYITTSLASGATAVTAANTTTATDVTYSHLSDHVETPEVSLQYLGINRLSLYLTADKRVDAGNQHFISPYAATTVTGAGVVTTALASPGSVYFQNANQDYENLKVGANWNASSLFTVRAEVFRKDHQNEFIGSDAIIGTKSYGSLFQTGYTFTGLTLSVICKPLPELSFNTRYQPQSGNMSVVGNTVTNGDGTEVTSGKSRAQMISETIDWTPYRQLYFQGNLNVVYDYLETAYPVVVVSATTNVPTPIQNANNNYITGSVLCGFVLDRQDDAQIQGLWQRADNYNPQIALGGQPYGAGFELQSISVGLKHKFTNRMLGDAKVGYFDCTDDTTGGFTNYRGPLFYIALEYAL